jgi:hypothetical protein
LLVVWIFSSRGVYVCVGVRVVWHFKQLLTCTAVTVELQGVNVSIPCNTPCHFVAALLLSHHKYHLPPQGNTHCYRCLAAAVSPQVSRDHLGGKLKQGNGPTWQQLWQLLQALTAKQQQQQGAVGQTSGQTSGQTPAMDATALFDQYLREAEAVPLTPPPYPGGLHTTLFFCDRVCCFVLLLLRNQAPG